MVCFQRNVALSCFSCKTIFLQEAAIAAVSGEDPAEPQEDEGMPSGFGSSSSLPANGGEDSEVARFGAAKEKKHSLENGISVFNRCSHACVSCPFDCVCVLMPLHQTLSKSSKSQACLLQGRSQLLQHLCTRMHALAVVVSREQPCSCFVRGLRALCLCMVCTLCLHAMLRHP